MDFLLELQGKICFFTQSLTIYILLLEQLPTLIILFQISNMYNMQKGEWYISDKTAYYIFASSGGAGQHRYVQLSNRSFLSRLRYYRLYVDCSYHCSRHDVAKNYNTSIINSKIHFGKPCNIVAIYLNTQHCLYLL